MSHLVGNPKDRFSRVAAHITAVISEDKESPDFLSLLREKKKKMGKKS